MIRRFLRAVGWGGGMTVLVAVVALFVFWPVYAGDGRSHPKTQCLSNVKQLAVAMQIYMSDADERLPAHGWLPELVPYMRNEEPLTCPEVLPAKYGYAMNVALMGIDGGKVKDPARAILFFETDALGRGVVANLAARNRDRHDGKGSNVSYLDSHAKSILKEDEP